MFKHRVFLTVLVVVAALASCTTLPIKVLSGSGHVVTQEVALSGFDRVDAGGAFQVSIRQSESYSVAIRIDDNLIECLEVVKAGSTLRIGFKSGCGVTSVTAMEADVTMPELLGVSLSGASRGSITGFSSSKGFAVELSGASRLDGDIQAGDVSVGASGASSATLSGSGQRLTINGSGASHVDLASLPVKDAKVEVSGASSATVNLTGRLDASASGASFVFYMGSPTLGSIETSGGSSIAPK